MNDGKDRINYLIQQFEALRGNIPPCMGMNVFPFRKPSVDATRPSIRIIPDLFDATFVGLPGQSLVKMLKAVAARDVMLKDFCDRAAWISGSSGPINSLLAGIRVDDRRGGRYVGIRLACPRNRERYTAPERHAPRPARAPVIVNDARRAEDKQKCLDRGNRSHRWQRGAADRLRTVLAPR